MFNNILLIVECSQETLGAAQLAIALARTYNANLIALHVVDTRAVGHFADFSGRSREEVAIELEENGWKYLYNIEEDAIENSVKTLLHLEEGRPVDKIIELAHKFKVDLLVYPRTQQAGTRGMKVAKATEELITHAPCPLLIV